MSVSKPPICHVYIMGYETRVNHKKYAMELVKAFQSINDLRGGEAYQPQWMLLHDEKRETVKEALSKAQCNWVVAIGRDITMALRDVYKEISPFPTTFFGMPNNEALDLGIIDSFERPGGWMSGVRGLDITPQPFLHEGLQEPLRFLLPVSSKILIPYDLAAWGNEAAALLKLDVEGAVADLIRIGFVPVVQQVSSKEELLTCVSQNIAQCYIVSSAWIPTEWEPHLVYRCSQAYPKRMVLSSNEDDGLSNGAAFLIRRKNPLRVVPDVIQMVRQGWYEHIWPGRQPVKTLSHSSTDPREVIVNYFMLPTLSATVLEEMKNNPDIVLEFKWPLPEAERDSISRKFKVPERKE
jgi:hypothetical protein